MDFFIWRNIYWTHCYCFVEGCLCLIELLSRLTTTKWTAMSDQKPLFVFNYYPLCLFTLTAASPLIHSCSTQKTPKTPSDDVRCFYVLFCLPSFACVSSLSVVLRDSQVLSYQKIYLVHGAYVLSFACRWVTIFTTLPRLISWSQIWYGGSAHFFQLPLRGSTGSSSVRFPTFLPSPLVWSSSSLVPYSDIECWPSDSQVTRWCVTCVFLLNSWFVASVKVFHTAGCAIDQHCPRTDLPINPYFTKSGGASAVWWFDQDRFPNLVCISSDFSQRQFGIYALHTQPIQVYTIGWCTRWCFVIFGCHIIPVHGFRYQAMQPCGYCLDNAVTPLCNAVTFRDISTPVLHLYVPFVY